MKQLTAPPNANASAKTIEGPRYLAQQNRVAFIAQAWLSSRRHFMKHSALMSQNDRKGLRHGARLNACTEHGEAIEKLGKAIMI